MAAAYRRPSQRERQQAERRRQWEAAVEEAKRRLVEHHHGEVMTERVRAWQEADAIRAYCHAVEERHGREAIPADQSASRWLALARARADDLQPLPTMPPDPEITPEALKPFLGRWSPYGPEGW